MSDAREPERATEKALHRRRLDQRGKLRLRFRCTHAKRCQSKHKPEIEERQGEAGIEEAILPLQLRVVIEHLETGSQQPEHSHESTQEFSEPASASEVGCEEEAES